MADPIFLTCQTAAMRPQRSRTALDQVARTIKINHLTEWYGYISHLDPQQDDEFRAIVASALYAGFTGGELARVLGYESSTIIRWAEGATSPPSDETRQTVKAGSLAIIARRILNWRGAEDTLAAQRSDWRPQRGPEQGGAELPKLDLESAKRKIEDLLREQDQSIARH